MIIQEHDPICDGQLDHPMRRHGRVSDGFPCPFALQLNRTVLQARRMKQGITHGVQDRSIAHVGGRRHMQSIHDACDSGNSNREFQGQFLSLLHAPPHPPG